MIIIWREMGGLVPLIIALSALVGGLAGGQVGVATALLVLTPALGFWGWWINLRDLPRISRRYIERLHDDEIREILLSDGHLRQTILAHEDLSEVILHGENLAEIVDRRHLQQLLRRHDYRNEHTLFFIPVQYWSVFTLATAIVVLRTDFR